MTEQPTSTDATPKHRTWVKVVAAVVAVAMVFGAGFVAFTVLTGEPERTISLPDTAGGMSRDTGLEQRNSTSIDAARQQVETVVDGGAEVSIGAYDNDDEGVGPTGPVFVIGAETDQEVDPDTILDSWTQRAEDNEFTTSGVSAGDGAVARCATQEDSGTTLCAWATSTTFGQLLPTTQGWTTEQLGDLMVDVRADVETTD